MYLFFSYPGPREVTTYYDSSVLSLFVFTCGVTVGSPVNY